MSELNPAQRLREAPSAGLGQRVPEPLHARVDELCDLVYDAGHERPTKARMVSALLLAASPDAEQLVSALAAFDRATVADAVVAERRNGNRISFPRRRSGPRSRSISPEEADARARGR